MHDTRMVFLLGAWSCFDSLIRFRPLPVPVHLQDDLLEDLVGLVDGHLAGADRAVSAASILEHQRAHVGLRGAVDDAVAAGHDDVLAPEAPHHLDRDVLLGIEAVEDEPIAGVDPAAREYILKTLVENYAEDAVVILSTHLISDVEPILDDVLFIKNGNIVLHEETDSIRERTGKSVDELFREEFRC